MLMERFIMLKMFMAAVGTSAASLGIISVVAPEKFAAARAKACGPLPLFAPTRAAAERATGRRAGVWRQKAADGGRAGRRCVQAARRLLFAGT